MFGCEERRNGEGHEGFEDSVDLNGRYSHCPKLFVPDCVWKFAEIETHNERKNIPGKSWYEQSSRYTKFSNLFYKYVDDRVDAMRIATSKK